MNPGSRNLSRKRELYDTAAQQIWHSIRPDRAVPHDIQESTGAGRFPE